MISAAELKQNRKSNIDDTLKFIESRIIYRDGKGERRVRYDFQPNDPVDDIMTSLIQHGYKVKKYEGYDQRNGGWCYIEINWD